MLAAAAGSGALLAALIHSPRLSPGAVLVLTVVLVAAAVAVVLAGHNQISDQVRLLAPAATVAAVLLLRHGTSGNRIRYELLLLLPILWLALQGSRGELTVAVIGMTAGLMLMNVSARDPASWTDQLLFALIAATVGATVHRLVGQVRRQASDVGAVTRVVREVASATDTEGARDVVCRAAIEIVDAQLALMLEPRGDGLLCVSAAWGSEVAAGSLVPIAGIDGDLGAALEGRPLGLDHARDAGRPAGGRAGGRLVPLGAADHAPYGRGGRAVRGRDGSRDRARRSDRPGARARRRPGGGGAGCPQVAAERGCAVGS